MIPPRQIRRLIDRKIVCDPPWRTYHCANTFFKTLYTCFKNAYLYKDYRAWPNGPHSKPGRKCCGVFMTAINPATGWISQRGFHPWRDRQHIMRDINARYATSGIIYKFTINNLIQDHPTYIVGLEFEWQGAPLHTRHEFPQGKYKDQGHGWYSVCRADIAYIEREAKKKGLLSST